MEKWKKCYITIAIIIFVVTCITVVLYICKISILPLKLGQIIKLFCFLMELNIIIFCITWAIKNMKTGIHNIKTCDDEIFERIDQYKKCWGEDRYYYIKQIQIINLYYKKGGKVDELVKNNEIEKLYSRADFLLVQNTLYDNYTTWSFSLIISIISSFICQMIDSKSVIVMFVWMAIILFCFFGLTLSRYTKKGQDGSYRYYIDDYERKLLLEKIQTLEEELSITDDDEQIMETKQIVINELIRIREKKKFKKQKQKLESDIKQIGQLDLCLGDYTSYYKRKICINGITGYLVYNQEEGKENNYIGDLNLVNQEYSILFKILNKYDLISYYENERI